MCRVQQLLPPTFKYVLPIPPRCEPQVDGVAESLVEQIPRDIVLVAVDPLRAHVPEVGPAAGATAIRVEPVGELRRDPRRGDLDRARVVRHLPGHAVVVADDLNVLSGTIERQLKRANAGLARVRLTVIIVVR